MQHKFFSDKIFIQRIFFPIKNFFQRKILSKKNFSKKNSFFSSEKKSVKFSLKIKIFFAKENSWILIFGLCLGFGKPCSKCLLFYYHCLTNNAQSTYCSIIIVWLTMHKMPIVPLSLFGKQCSKHLLFYYHCLPNNAQNNNF